MRRWGWLAWIAACGEAGNTDDPTDTPAAGTIEILTGDVETGWSDGIGDAARFQGVTAMCAPDERAFILVSDTFNGTIRRIDPATGEVRTIAGAAGAPGVADGVDARFTSPRGLACAPDGSRAWVIDDGALREILLSTGEVTTLAGQAGAHDHVDGGPAVARFGYLVHAMVASPDGGRLWLADRSSNAIRQVDLTDLTVSTLSADGWDGPGGLTVVDGGLWVADTFNDRLRRLDLDTLEVSTLDVEDLAAPQGVAWDGEALVTVGFGAEVLRIDPSSGAATTVTEGFGGAFSSPLSWDGTLWYAGLSASDLRSLDLASGADASVAGPMAPYGHVDGPLAEARFDDLLGVTGTPDGRTLWVADGWQGLVREIDRDGDLVTTLDLPALSLPSAVALSPDGATLAIADADAGAVYGWPVAGGALTTWIPDLGEPTALAFAPDGTLYVADGGAGSVVARDPGGAVTTLVGDGGAGRLRAPAGLALDGRTLWISDRDASTIRALDLDSGELRTVVGDAGQDGDLAGPAADARLYGPAGLAISAGGALLIADNGNHKLRRLDVETLVVTDVAGSATRAGGLPPGGEHPLDAAGLGYLTGVFAAGDEVFVTSQAAVHRLVPGGDGW